MHEKLLVGLLIGILAIGFVSLVAPASAHFTLGDYTPSFRFHVDDFDPHVPGPLAYVWPGSGLSAFVGNPLGFPPGYQTPYPNGNPPGQPSGVYQLEANSYAPFGSILTTTDQSVSRGSLIFALNLSRPCELQNVICADDRPVIGSRLFNYTGITIYIPPEFDVSSAVSAIGLVSTSFSTTSAELYLGRSGAQDPIGPNWWVFYASGNIQFWPQHDYAEWYYIRINNVIAPKIAGKYFFKIFLWDRNQMDVPGGWNTNSQIAGGAVRIPTSGATALTVPVENWPVLLVKGEIDPAIVTGTIRYGGFNQSLYSRPINLPGMVDLVGTANDPYTGQPTGRSIEARSYFNASAAGHYEVEGVAAGIYTIYAQAAGYPTQVIAQNVTLLSGQSFHLDGYLNPGAVIGGQVFSKHLFGEEPWPGNPRPILVEIYSSNSYGASNLVAWSPWNKTHAGYMSYDWPQGSAFAEPLPVAYPWDAVTPYAFSYYSQLLAAPAVGPWISHDAISCGANPTTTRDFDPCGKPDGVGPAQYWWVDSGGVFTNGGGDDSFIYQFGVKGVYGAPTGIDGHVPQPYATWINGLTPGRYWVRAWVNGYVQTLQDGITFDEYHFDVAANEWAGDIFMPMDLRVGSSIIKTVHFHDQPNTLQDCPINGCANNQAQGISRGDRYLIAEARDVNGNLMGFNFTYVRGDASTATIQINGLGMLGPDLNKGNMKFSYLRYQQIKDYGLPAGTYTVYVYLRGYLQDAYESVSVTLSGSPAIISNHLYRGARFDITVYSEDWEHPDTQRAWEFPGAPLDVYVYRATVSASVGLQQPAGLGGSLIGGGCGLLAGEYPDHCRVIEFDGPGEGASDNYATGGFVPWDQKFYTGGFLTSPSAYRLGNWEAIGAFDTMTYSFTAYAYGYVEHDQPSAFAQLGGFADVRINLIKGVNITINIPFKTEGVYTPTIANMSMRVRVFNDQGQLVATASTKKPDVTAYNNGQPLGIGRGVGNRNSWTYYVDPFASSPSITNGLTAIDGDTAADTFLWHGTWNGITGWQGFDSDPDHDGIPDFSWYNNNRASYTAWIPAGTDQVRVFIAGIYDIDDPLKGTPPLSTVPNRYFQTSGIDGFSTTLAHSYEGGWTVEVDTWNEYPNPTFNPDSSARASNWYPPVEGLLEGESFYTIPNSPKGPFGYVGDQVSWNGMGPYAQRSVWAIPNAHLGAEASGIFELDKRGYISGNLYGFTFSNDLRTVSWGAVTAVGAQGAGATFTSYSWDGFYDMYLDPGSYAFTIAVPGYNSVSSSVNISAGQATSGVTFQLERNNMPVPEFGTALTVTLGALVISACLLAREPRRRRQV
jgi:hypothetical protein